jgi:ADP-ribose pyrophosphatase YjhB (NUDIX family)
MTTIDITQTDQEILKAIHLIEKMVITPGNGLPEELFLFISRLTPLVNVDLLIRNEQGKILLTWRDDPLFGQGWHVPGGCVRIGESFGDRISAVAATELGTRTLFMAKPLAIFETVDKTRPSRTHHVTLLFDCKLISPPALSQAFVKTSPQVGAWAWHAVCPDDLLQTDYRCWFSPEYDHVLMP